MDEKVKILWSSSAYYHYYPLGLFFPGSFGILEPFWFAAVSSAFYLGCSVLVMKIYRDIVGSLAGGFLAALIFATALPNSQVIYWKTGTQTIAMAFFSLLSLVFFIKYLKDGSKTAFAGSYVSFVASMMCIELGVVTFGILGLYDMILYSVPRFLKEKAERKKIVVQFACRHITFITIPIILTFLKLAFGFVLSPFPMAQRPWGLMPLISADVAAKLLDFNGLFLPSGTGIAFMVIAVVLVLILFLGYAFSRTDKKGLFFLLASLGSILAISISAGGPNARYFCLPLTLYACFLTLFFRDIARAVAWALRKMFARAGSVSNFLTREPENIQLAFSAVLCLTVAVGGLRANIIRRGYWETASTIERNIAQTVENFFLFGTIGEDAEQKLYLLNIPEHFVSEKHSIFYVASNSIRHDLRHRLGDSAQRIELIATGKHFELPLENERVVYRALGWKEQLSLREIEELIEDGHIVLQFSPFSKTLVPLGAGK
jgi:hypothetical protein